MTGLITEGLSYWSKSTPQRPAIVFDGHDVVDYATLDRWTDNAAHHLAGVGLVAGQRVGVVGANSLEWCVAAIGALKLGAVVAPYNNRFTVPELAHLIDDSDPTLVLTDRPTLERVSEAARGRSTQVLDLAQFTVLRDVAPHPLPEESQAMPDDVAIIIYTSGSTAAPKGVIYTHRSMQNFIAELAIMEPAFRPGARIVFTLSMSGAPGLPWHVLQPLTRGMTIFYEKGFDAKATLARVTVDRIDVMSGVPMQFEQIASLADFADADLSSLQLCTIAGARVPVPTLRDWQDKGVMLRQAYGMTELSGLSSVNPASEAASRPGSIGRGFMFSHHRVVRPDGSDCAPAEPGELIVRSRGGSPGYWRNPEATRQLIRDGWIHTGDVAVSDDEGFLYIVDRMKDIIISGGYNIAPSEIEATIGDLPGVVEVCVIAAADDKFGETPAAIVHGAEALTPSQVVDWCATRLAPYKVPRYVVIDPKPLPRMTSGKINRRQLKQDHADVATKQARVR